MGMEPSPFEPEIDGQQIYYTRDGHVLCQICGRVCTTISFHLEGISDDWDTPPHAHQNIESLAEYKEVFPDAPTYRLHTSKLDVYHDHQIEKFRDSMLGMYKDEVSDFENMYDEIGYLREYELIEKAVKAESILRDRHEEERRMHKERKQIQQK